MYFIDLFNITWLHDKSISVIELFFKLSRTCLTLDLFVDIFYILFSDFKVLKNRKININKNKNGINKKYDHTFMSFD